MLVRGKERKGVVRVKNIVPRVYGGGNLADKSVSVLVFGGNQRLALLDTFSRKPKRDVAHTFQSSNASKACYRFGGILAQHKNRRPVRGVPVRRLPLLKSVSNHNIVVHAKISYRGLYPTNHSKRDTISEMSSHRSTSADGRNKTVGEDLVSAPRQVRALDLMHHAAGMAASLVEMLLSIVTDVAPHEKCH